MDIVLCFVTVRVEDLAPHFERPTGAKIFRSVFCFQSQYHPVPWLKVSFHLSSSVPVVWNFTIVLLYLAVLIRDFFFCQLSVTFSLTHPLQRYCKWTLCSSEYFSLVLWLPTSCYLPYMIEHQSHVLALLPLQAEILFSWTWGCYKETFLNF